MQYDTPPPRTASMLFAVSQGQACDGKERCHWCGGPCEPLWKHDDVSPLPFTRTNSVARHVSGMYVCVGCWLWRRRSVTVFHYDEGFKDRQKAQDWGWWIEPTPNGAKVLTPSSLPRLWEQLLKPPPVFCLMLLDGRDEISHLQLGVVNICPEVVADTPLQFTVNNVVFTYSIYDVERSALNPEEPSTAGVGMLARLLGPAPIARPEVPSRKMGHPSDLQVIKEKAANNPKRAIKS